MMKIDDIREGDNGYRWAQLPKRRVFFWNAMDDADKAWTPLHRHMRRAFNLVHRRDLEMRTWDLEKLEMFIDQLERWTAGLRAEIDQLRGSDLSKRKRIELLRNTKGRTPEEAAAFLAKADQLEQEMNG
jgi:hypothetical protein